MVLSDAFERFESLHRSLSWVDQNLLEYFTDGSLGSISLPIELKRSPVSHINPVRAVEYMEASLQAMLTELKRVLKRRVPGKYLQTPELPSNDMVQGTRESPKSLIIACLIISGSYNTNMKLI